MKYLYLLSVSNSETGENVCNLEAYSLESLEEQLRKIPIAVDKYETEKQESEDAYGEEESIEQENE